MSNFVRTNLVLDKSYLQGYSKPYIFEKCKEYKFLITSSLTYELVKDEKNRAALFGKIPPAPKYSVYIPAVSQLIQYEIATSSDCGKPSDHIQKRDYSALRRLRNIFSPLKPSDIKAMGDERDFLSKLLYDGELQLIKQIFEKHTNKEIASELNELINGKVTDFAFMNNFLREQRKNGANLPEVNFFTHKSVSYRHFQVMLLFAFDTCNRYQNFSSIAENKNVVEKIRHDINDMSYLTLALLEGGFAVKEKKLIEWWKILKDPNTQESQLQT